MKSHSTKQIIIALSVVVLLLVASHFVAFLFIKNTATKVLTLEREAETLKSQALEYSKYTPEDLLSLAQSVSAKFVPRGDVVDFIESIETKGRAQNVSVTVRSVGTEKRTPDAPDTDDKEVLRLKLETVGSWSNTLKFINYLEHLPYKVSVQGLGMSKVLSERNTSNSDGASEGDGGGEAIGGTVGGTGSTPSLWKSEIEITVLKLK
jgi:hypothetical protein